MISKTYTDRIAKPLYLKLFIPWWFINDDEPTAPEWYLPERPWLWRQAMWYCRNPLVNGCDYVWGVRDRNLVAYSSDWPLPVINHDGALPSAVEITDWHDAGLTGWKFGVLHVARIFWLPYVSYSGTRVLWHVGWYAGGRFQIKFNILK